jgi:hypothetical protein
LTFLESGVYFIKIIASGNELIKKLIIRWLLFF